MTTLFFDMDGVVADWDAHIEHLLGVAPKAPDADPDPTWGYDHWQKIKQHQRLYADLPLVDRANELIDLGRQFRDKQGYQLLFLTAVPRGNDVHWAFWDKFQWCQRYFPDIPVHFGPFSDSKHQHCQPGDILIDDRKSNIEQWTAAGGRGFYVKSGEIGPAIDYLKGLL